MGRIIKLVLACLLAICQVSLGRPLPPKNSCIITGMNPITNFESGQSTSARSTSAHNTSAPVKLLVVPGQITPAYVTIASGTSPGLLTATEASGGSCGGSYNYQWQSSTNDFSWSNISGVTGLTYNPGNLTAGIYYRVLVKCASDTEYTNVCQVSVGSPGDSLNFIRVRTILKAGVLDTVTADGLTSPYDVAQTTQYFDGLDRLVQTVAKQASPLQNDMVTTVVLDNFGRQATQYLPYTATTNNGNYKATALVDQVSFNSAQFPGENY